MTAPLSGKLQHIIMHKLHPLKRLHYLTYACDVVRNYRKNLNSVKAFQRSNSASQHQHGKAELRLYPNTTELMVFNNQGSQNTLMHLIIYCIFQHHGGMTYLN